jgi:hypothetical protein
VLLDPDMVKGERTARGEDGGAERDRQKASAAGPADDPEGGDQDGHRPRHALEKAEHARLQAEQVLAGVRHRQRAQADRQNCRKQPARITRIRWLCHR